MSKEHVTIVGPMMAPGELSRRVAEELARLVDAAGRDAQLLSDDEISHMRAAARQAVLKRLRADGTALVGDDGGLDSLIAEARQEFGSSGAVVDERSGVLCHRKAEVIAAAASGGKPIDEAAYLRALNAVADDSGRRYLAEDEVSLHCESASALSDLAKYRLAERGLRFGSPEYEAEYLREISAISRQSGLAYRGA